MSDSEPRRKIRKGPNYHRIPEVRARRRKIVTFILVMLIVAWAGVSIWLSTRDDPNIPAPGRRPSPPAPVAVNPLQSVQP
ncbi:MAG: hypothetical protein U1F87_19015 [Kiritimatiellia bacterium]